MLNGNNVKHMILQVIRKPHRSIEFSFKYDFLYTMYSDFKVKFHNQILYIFI